MRINQNSMAINAYRNLSTNNMSLGKSLEKLSSGFRINRAADDAAGLVISQNLRAQVSGLRQASRNAQDGISVVQTAEGALNEVHSMLNRMRDLSVQAANSGANSAEARSAAQAEITALKDEITRISDKTEFGGKKLLDGSYGQSYQSTGAAGTFSAVTVAADSNDEFSVSVDGGSAVVVNLAAGTYSTAEDLQTEVNRATAAALRGAGYEGNEVTFSFTTDEVGATWEASGSGAFTLGAGVDGSGAADVLDNLGITAGAATVGGTGGTFQVGSNAGDTVSVSIGDMDAAALGVGAIDVTSDAGAAAAITALDGAIKNVSTTRGNLGALQNRFESMVNSLAVTTENLVASESRIRDTDMAAEMTSFTKSQILSQAGTSMLAQANQVPQSVLSLLR